MKKLPVLCALAILTACASPATTEEESPQVRTATFGPLPDAKDFVRLDLPNLDDNVSHDTLLIYTTHDLGNGTFVMAARNVEEDREGLRLILYRPRPDSSAEVLAVSKPAYDSSVMLPTYFTTGDTADGLIILANYGERESWGQNVFWLKNGQFRDLGWLDVAQRTWVERDGGQEQKRINIAPSTQVRGAQGQFLFTFSTDSVQLYDDLNGGREVMLPADRIDYLFDGNGMVLRVDGQPRFRKEPL